MLIIIGSYKPDLPLGQHRGRECLFANCSDMRHCYDNCLNNVKRKSVQNLALAN